MSSLSKAIVITAVLAVLLSAQSVQSFSTVSNLGHVSTCCPSSYPLKFKLHPHLTFHRMSDTETSEEPNVNVSAENQDVESPQQQQEEKDKKEDPLVAELKETIQSLESQLKQKRGSLQNLKDMAEQYSSAGYARQVALVENNKRMRGASMADTKSAAQARVIQTFLPVREELEAVKAKYVGNQFASTLAAVDGEFKGALQELGVTEYSVEVGKPVKTSRVVVVEEEYSEEYQKGTVIRQLKSGLEILGNVIRPAECVGSLGMENKEEEEEENIPLEVIGESEADTAQE